MSEKLENKNKRRRGLPGPPLPCAAQQQQAGPARRRPSPPPPPSPVAFLLCQEDGHAPGARGHAPRPPPPSQPAWLLLDTPVTPRASPTPSHFSLALWTSLPLAPLFPLPRPNGAAATDESHRGYRPPHASPTPQGAPPRPPLPPHRSTALRKPCSVALKLAPNLRPPANFRGFASSSPSPASPLPPPDPL